MKVKGRRMEPRKHSWESVAPRSRSTKNLEEKGNDNKTVGESRKRESRESRGRKEAKMRIFSKGRERRRRESKKIRRERKI